MTSDTAKGFLSAIRCVEIEARQWERLAGETSDPGARAVMVACSEALSDTAARMVTSLVRSGEVSAEEVLRL